MKLYQRIGAEIGIGLLGLVTSFSSGCVDKRKFIMRDLENQEGTKFQMPIEMYHETEQNLNKALVLLREIVPEISPLEVAMLADYLGNEDERVDGKEAERLVKYTKGKIGKYLVSRVKSPEQGQQIKLDVGTDKSKYVTVDEILKYIEKRSSK